MPPSSVGNNGVDPEEDASLTSHFQQVFDEYNFYITSNLFDNKPYKQASIETCEQNASFLVKHIRTSGKNFKQNLSKNCSKSTKMTIKICKYSKFSRGSMRMPPEPCRTVFVPQFGVSSQKKFLNKLLT